MRQVCQTNRPSEYLSIIQGESLKGRTKQNSTTQSRLEIPLLRPLHMFSGHLGKPNRTLASLAVTTADWWWSERPGDWAEAEFFSGVLETPSHLCVLFSHVLQFQRGFWVRGEGRAANIPLSGYPDGHPGQPAGDGGCVQGQAAQVSTAREPLQKHGCQRDHPGKLALNNFHFNFPRSWKTERQVLKDRKGIIHNPTTPTLT